MGCGNGLFLRFLSHLGVQDFLGIDGDPRVIDELPPELARSVHIADFDDFFAAEAANRQFDRIVLFDVLEHFTPEGGAELLRKLARLLGEGGRIVLRVPNMGSPLGLGVQYNDVTHLTAYSPGSLGQVGRVAGLRVAGIYPQAYTSLWREIRERAFLAVVSWFMAMPPKIWSPNLIAVLEKPAD